MTRHEIDRKLDEIVDFAGIERYLDTPVKRFSSGMTVRLGFAVAAFLEPEILVVDEVLAVGDAEFQKKAIGKMKDVSQGGGRTVLFVSHNMNAVKMLCNNGLVLQNGKIEYTGTAQDCVNHYLSAVAIENIVSKVTITEKHREHFPFLTHDIDFLEVEMLNEEPSFIANDEPLKFRVKLKATHIAPKFQLCIFIQDSGCVRVLFCQTEVINVPKNRDIFDVEVTVPYHSLPKGRYSVRFETNLQDFSEGSTHFDFVQNTLAFEVKYIHYAKKDEFLFWDSHFGETLQLEKIIQAKII